LGVDGEAQVVDGTGGKVGGSNLAPAVKPAAAVVAGVPLAAVVDGGIPGFEGGRSGTCGIPPAPDAERGENTGGDAVGAGVKEGVGGSDGGGGGGRRDACGGRFGGARGGEADEAEFFLGKEDGPGGEGRGDRGRGDREIVGEKVGNPLVEGESGSSGIVDGSGGRGSVGGEKTTASGGPETEFQMWARSARTGTAARRTAVPRRGRRRGIVIGWRGARGR
jgi:hypothetical protein